MGFFDWTPPDDAADDEDEELDDDFDDDPRSTYLGGVVPVELLVARSETAAVAVRGIVAYPDGFEFTLATWVRRPVRRRGRLTWGSSFRDPDEFDGGQLPEDLLRFGIEFPDGARVRNIDGSTWRLSPDATDPMHGMESGGGGGSDREYTQDYWAWPVPEDGRLAFVGEWPAYDIPESRVEIDADLIAEAARRAQPIWLNTADRPTHFTRALMHRRLNLDEG